MVKTKRKYTLVKTNEINKRTKSIYFNARITTNNKIEYKLYQCHISCAIR